MTMYRYLGCGLDNVMLRNGYEQRQTASGVEIVAIQDVEGLHRAIALSLCEVLRPLTAKEFRFLRKEMDMSQRQLASMADVTEQTVSLWEREGAEINSSAERLLRILVKETLTDNAEVRAMLERFCSLDREVRAAEQIEFELEQDAEPEWRQAA
jgi:putative transcriptional regulator